MSLLKLFLPLVFISNFSYALTDHIVDDVFIVGKGFDTNDEIEFTYISLLPNYCYEPAQSKVEKKLNEIDFHFYIKKRNITDCASITPNMNKNPIYFTKTIKLGNLKEGDYKLHFKTKKGNQTKAFSVVKAASNTIDEFEYAPLTDIYIPNIVYNDAPLQLIMSGISHNSCLSFNESMVEVNRVGNIIIVLPKTKYLSSNFCVSNEELIETIISLGTLESPGRYLIHVRTQSGLSLNKVIHVKNRLFDPRR